MPGLHLPWVSCDNLLFSVRFFRHRRLLRATAYVFVLYSIIMRFFKNSRGADRDNFIKRLRGYCMEIVQCQSSHRTVSASLLQNRAASVQRQRMICFGKLSNENCTIIARRLCNARTICIRAVGLQLL